jgi:hypothetical protein
LLARNELPKRLARQALRKPSQFHQPRYIWTEGSAKLDKDLKKLKKLSKNSSFKVYKADY